MNVQANTRNTRFGVAVRSLSIGAIVFSQVFSSPVLAQDRSGVVVSGACLSKLGNPYASGDQELQSVEIEGKFTGNAGEGRVRLEVPVNCLSVAATVDEVNDGSVVDVEEPDANKIVGDAIDQSEQALVAGGVDPAIIEGIFDKLRIENDLADFDDPEAALPVLRDFAENQQEQFEDSGDDGFANAAMGAAMVAGCIALTGGAACAALAPLLSGLFGTEVTTEELEQGLGAIDRISKGESLTEDDFSLLEKFGAPKEIRPVVEALQSGEIVEIVRVTGQTAGLEDVQTDVLAEIAQAAKDGTISCARVSEIAEGRIKTRIAISARFRAQIDALIASRLKDSEHAATLRCVRNLFLAG